MTKFAVSRGIGHITEKILNEKLHFLCSGITFFVVEEVSTPIPTKPPPVEAKAYVPRQIYGGLYVL